MSARRRNVRERDRWSRTKAPLDAVARSIEKSENAFGIAKTGKERDASGWLDDSWRTSIVQPMSRAELTGEVKRTERYVIVDGKGFQAPTDLNDAEYPSTEPDSSTLIEDAQRFRLRHRRKAVEDPDQLRSFFKACMWEMEVTYARPRSITLMSLRLYPLIRPRFSSCLPLPSDKLEWRCTESGATWQAIQSLARVFGGARPPTALITGPPGSGKEAYARAVHFGQANNANSDARSLVTVSVAEVGANELMKKLKEDGLLERLQSENGTLFLDEVDKAPEQVRSSLLRILESRQYEDKDGRLVDCDKVAFVMAAGKELGELRGQPPPDFWTRMETHIPVADPLTATSQDERKRVLGAFFKFFWWDAVSDWLAGLLSFRGNVSDWDAFFSSKANQGSLDFAKQVFEATIGPLRAIGFEPNEEISLAAEKFAHVLSPHLERRQLSLRGLRSAVGAVHRSVRAHILGRALSIHNKDWATEFTKRVEDAIYNAVGTVLQVLPE